MLEPEAVKAAAPLDVMLLGERRSVSPLEAALYASLSIRPSGVASLRLGGEMDSKTAGDAGGSHRGVPSPYRRGDPMGR